MDSILSAGSPPRRLANRRRRHWSPGDFTMPQPELEREMKVLFTWGFLAQRRLCLEPMGRHSVGNRPITSPLRPAISPEATTFGQGEAINSTAIGGTVRIIKVTLY